MPALASAVRTSWFVSIARAALLACSMLSLPCSISAQPPPSTARKPLACAVEGSRGLRSDDVCRALGRELARTIVVVDDGRAVKTGDSIQVMHDDVQWSVVWLVSGHVRAWTRVSRTEAADDQLRFLVRAARALMKQAASPSTECVRLDPNGGRAMRAPELSYPWTELKPCARRLVEVPDPWWLPSSAK